MAHHFSHESPNSQNTDYKHHTTEETILFHYNQILIFKNILNFILFM